MNIKNGLILYIMLLSFFVYKSDKVYLHISGDCQYMYIKRFNKIIRIGLLLEILCFVMYIISTCKEKYMIEMMSLSYFLFILGNLLFSYAFQYITCRKRFPKAKRTTMDEKTIIYWSIIFLYAIGFGIYYLFF